MSVNKVILVGNLGQKPELKNLPNGQAVANFSVATNEKWEDKSGQKQERTEWHRITVWGKQAENAAKYLDKGRQVYVEGKLQTRSYEKDGVTKYVTEIQAQLIQFLGGNPAAGGGAAKAPGAPASSAPGAGGPGFNADDDIPF